MALNDSDFPKKCIKKSEASVCSFIPVKILLSSSGQCVGSAFSSELERKKSSALTAYDALCMGVPSLDKAEMTDSSPSQVDQ